MNEAEALRAELRATMAELEREHQRAERYRVALDVALAHLRTFVRDQEHEILSAESMRFVAQDALAEMQRILAGE